MKRYYIVLLSFLAVISKAQIPQAFNYQAVAHTSTGQPLQYQHINVRFSIHDGSVGAEIVYQEIDTATTNEFGLFTMAIGNGSVTMGTFAAINWSTGNKYLQVEFESNGSSSYTDMGTLQLLSVPYAAYSGDAATVKNAMTLQYLSH